jgi:long-subunit acyl-CoA synthetase (AMP-forming)
MPLGQEGEITVAGDGVMVGYHKNPAATRDVIYHADGKFYRDVL